MVSFSSFKDYMTKNYPKIVETHRLKSKLIKANDNPKILKIVAWDSVLEQAIEDKIITKFSTVQG